MRRRRFYRLTAAGRKVLGAAAPQLGRFLRGAQPRRRHPPCLIGTRWSARALGTLPLDPARAADIVDELAQHVAQHYADLIASGVAPEPAVREALAPLDDPARLAIEIARADRPRPPLAPAPPATTARRCPPIWAAISAMRCACCCAPRLRHRRAADAGARHRRQHRDLQRPQRRPAAAAALRRSRPPRR